MKFFIISCLLAMAVAMPERAYSAPPSYDSREVIEILKDVRDGPHYDGTYSFDMETANGIKRYESGAPLDIENNPTGQQGGVSFTFPNGEDFQLSFVADDGGYQPESAWLPVAPEFPHPIPQFVLDQIAKAAREDQDGSSERYSAPPPPPSRYN